MITNKDIRIENGNIILNGDKYPLDGQSPEAIMAIVKDNSDTTPTENSNNPVKSGGIYSKIGDLTQTGLTGDSVAAQLAMARGDIADINTALLPIDAVVKRFNLSANSSLDTGINANNTYSMGFVAIVSSHSANNSGRMNIYMGGVAYRKQDGTVGDINYSRLGGVGLGSGAAGDNLSFSISNDKLQITAPQGQDTLSVTLILSKR